MSGKTYRQYDSKWGSKNYNGSSTMAQAGCGPTSCATIIYTAKPSVTPWTVAQFMKDKGYAVYGNGTARAGIPAALKHWGFSVTAHDTMTSLWDKLGSRSSQRYGVILFKGGTRGGVTWTTGGHYVAFTRYKVKNGKHYLYTRDPGQRKNDGWHCYETTMKGLVAQVWSCKNSALETTKTEKVTTLDNANKSSTNAEKIGNWVNKIAWPYGTAPSKYEYDSGAPTKACKTAMKARGYDTKIEYSDCGYFVNTVIYHALGKKVKVLPKTSEPLKDSINGLTMVYKGKSLDPSVLKEYDIVAYKRINAKGQMVQHTGVYIGKVRNKQKKLVRVYGEAGRGSRFGVIHTTTKFTSKKLKEIRVYRAKES